MRILLLSYNVKDPGGWYRHGTVVAQRAAGHEVIDLDLYALAAVYGLDGMQRVVLHYARTYRPAVMLAFPPILCLEASTCAALRQMGIPLVGLRFDDGMWIGPHTPLPETYLLRQSTFLDDQFDLVFTTCRLAVTVFADQGLPVPVYGRLPIAWQTFPLHPGPKRPVISFVGTPMRAEDQSWRVLAVRALVAAGLPVEVYGDDWRHLRDLQAIAGPTLPLADVYRVFGESAVNLSLPGTFVGGFHSMVKHRTLEIAACGGLQLADWCEELSDYFELERDLITYRNLDELVAKASDWVARPDAAAAVGQRARKACEQMGWERWWQDVSDRLQAKGIHLDLDAEPAAVDADRLAALANVSLVMGHVHEAKGDAAIAEMYFREALALVPDDSGALAGLARVSRESDTVLASWRRIAETVTFTQPLTAGKPFRLRGIGAIAGTGFALEAACHWLDLAERSADPAEREAARQAMQQHPPEFVLRAAQQMARAGMLAGARAAVNQVLAVFPNSPPALAMQSQLAGMEDRP